MRTKITAIFLISFGVFVAALVYRVDQLLYADKLAWNEAQSRSQMSAIVHGLEGDLNSLQTLLTLSFSELEAGKAQLSDQPFLRFQMMAKLLPPNPSEGRPDWQMLTAFFKEKSSVQKWAQSYTTLALKTVKPASLKKGSVSLFTVLDPSRKPFVLLLTQGPGNWYASLMGPEIFQKLMDRQKGLKSELFLVNQIGQALGHTTPEYVGSLLSSDPTVQEITKSGSTTGGGIFKNLKGEQVQGFYEQIGNSNFYAVITTPLASLMQGRESVKMQLGLLGGGLCLLGLAIFFFAYKPDLIAAARPAPVPTGPTTVTAPTISSSSSMPVSNVGSAQASAQDRMQAYKTAASSLSHELKNPLTSILGHTQLAKTQGDGKLQEHLQQIETEARSARDLIQKLLVFTGEDKSKTSSATLNSVIAKSLKAIEGKLMTKGVRLQKDLKDVPAFEMAPDQMAKAIENILLNSIEAMERAPQKNLAMRLTQEGTEILLEIEDSGEGISATNLAKVFDPFFTTRSGAHVGLGLSTALGILREFHGEVKMKSETGKGTTVQIRFRPPSLTSVASSQPPAVTSASSVLKPKENLLKVPGLDSSAGAYSDELTQDIHAHRVPEDTVAIDPLVIDESVENMMDEDPLLDKKVPEVHAEALPPAPQEEFSDEKTVDIGVFQKQGFTAKVDPPKIDKPKIEIKKKATKSDQFQVQVRRPGGRA